MHHSNALLKEIHQSFQHAAHSQPAYKEMLPFFENLFEMQEAAVDDAHPDVPGQATAMSKLRKRTTTPILERRKISIDMPAAQRLFKVLCEAAQTASPKLAHAASVLSACLQSRQDIIKRGFECIGSSDQAALQTLSEDLGIDKDILIFFLYHSIWPSVARHVQSFSNEQLVRMEWQEGFCPICGSTPNLAYLADNGKRFLVCGFCRYQWAFNRIKCPYCANEHAETMGYFFNEEEKAYRVHFCDSCHQYIKTVDTRLLARDFYPPLEDLMTIHLDLQAEQRGYLRSGDALPGG